MKYHFIPGIIVLSLFCCLANAQGSGIELKSSNQKTIKMKEFSLLVRVPLTYSAEQAKAVGRKWSELLDRWKEDSIYIVSFAFPGEGSVVSGPQKSVEKASVISDNLRVVSNLFIRAESMEKAIQLGKLCPVLEYGGSIEVREIPPRPVKPD